MRFYIGIDNGLTGAVALLDPGGKIVSAKDTPTEEVKVGKNKRHKFIVHEMTEILMAMMDYDPEPFVVLEQAFPMPGQGGVSMFTTGLGFGLWQGILSGLGLDYMIVHPRTWTKEMMKDTPAGKPKQRSIMCCQALFPDACLMKPRGRKATMDGRADALLLAEYGRRLGEGR